MGVVAQECDLKQVAYGGLKLLNHVEPQILGTEGRRLQEARVVVRLGGVA
jgi:hypothetical protein